MDDASAKRECFIGTPVYFKDLPDFQFFESFVVVCGIVDYAIRLIHKPLGSAILARIVHIGFVVGTFGQKAFPIPEGIAADHHANRCPRVEIPLRERFARLGFVKLFTLILSHIICGQLVELAQVRRHGILGRVQARFFNRLVNGQQRNARR